MAFMQLDFDVVPFLVGVGIFVAANLLLRALAPRKSGARPAKKADPSELDSELEASGAEAGDQPEPAPEPIDEQEATPTGRSLRARHFALLALVLVAAVVGLLHWSRPAAAGLGEEVAAPASDEPVTTPIGEPTTPEAPAQAAPKPAASSESVGEAAVSIKIQRQELTPSEAEALTIPGGRSTEPAFNIKLTRQAMNNENDDIIRSAYYGTLKVGTPGVEMTVVFDTGSGHVVLPSMFCKSDTCKAHTRYRKSGSSTARDIDANGNTWKTGPRESISVSFGTGDIEGVFVEDVICLSDITDGKSGSGNKTIVRSKQAATEAGCTSIHFVAATEMSEEPFKAFNFDGILGLGLSGLSQTGSFNFMEVMSQALREKGATATQQTFGVFLGDNEAEDSEIALGGWAGRHTKEELSWSTIFDPEQGHWIVPIKRIRINSEIVSFCEDGSCRAAMDTGTSLLSVPTAAFRGIYEGLRHRPGQAGHCRGYGPFLNIELEQFTLSLGPKDYSKVKKAPKSALKAAAKPTLKTSDVTGRTDLRCLPMLMTLDLEEPIGPKLFILGEPVLRKYYTVYDGQRLRVGVGRARHVQGPSRDDLLEMAPEVEPVAKGRLPTMFDIFRWRKAMQ